MARPTDFTDDKADRICEGIASGISLIRICEADDMPRPATVYRWLREKPAFCDNYVRAREDQADYMADELLAVADNPEIDPADKRIRVDARKWLASKHRPKKYGDKMEHSTGEGGFIINVVRDTD